MFVIFFQYLFIYSFSQSTELVPQGITISWSGSTNDNYLYIVTDDGFFHRINIETSTIDWSIDTGGPLYNSTYNTTTTYFPSLDGFLFSFSAKYGYRRFPIPIRELVFLAPFIGETGQIFTSHKSTTVFFIDDDGNIISSIESNSSIPLQTTNDNKFTLVRIDYALCVHGEYPETIRFSEFSIIPATKDIRNGTEEIQTIVQTNFNGYITLSVDENTEGIFLPGIPVLAIGSNGAYQFSTKRDGNPLAPDDIFVFYFSGAPVGVPGHRLVSHNNGLLADNMPMINGTVGDDNKDALAIGTHHLNPYFFFKPLMPQADLVRIANIMTDVDFQPTFSNPIEQLHYWAYASTLLVFFFGLKMIESLKLKLRYSIPITVDPNDPTHGTVAGERCSIVRVKNFDETTLTQKNELVGIPTIITMQNLDDGRKEIFFQPLNPYNFHDPNFNPKLFIQKAMICLQSLFRNGLVHGSISSETVYAGGNNEPLFGGYENSMKRSNELNDRANDILNVGLIVDNYINSILEKEKDIENNEKELLKDSAYLPFLIDLLNEMTNQDPEERPTPEEVLRHPIFFEGYQKLDVYKQASDFLNKPENKNLKQMFENHASEIIGNNWMHGLDKDLIDDALQNTDYADNSAIDLVRFIRNKWIHPPDEYKRTEFMQQIFKDSDKYFEYFQTMFPNLFLYTYYFIDRYYQMS